MGNTFTWILPAGTAASGGTSADWSPSGGPPHAGDTGVLTNGGTILLDDASFSANTFNLGNGLLLFTGDSSVSNGNPTFDSATTLTTNTGSSVAQHSTIDANGVFITFGSIVADGATGSTLSIALGANGTVAGSFQNYGDILVDAGNTLTVSATGGATFSDLGAVDVEGGSALISAAQALPSNQTGQNNGNVNYVIGQNGSLEIAQSSSAVYENIQFDGAGTLKLDQPGSFFGDVAGFAVGDTIDLGVVNIASIVFDGNGDVSALNGSGGTVFFANTFNNSGNNSGGGNDGPLDGYGNAGSYTLGANGGTAAYLQVTEGSGGDTVLTALPLPGPSTWLWLNGASASADTSADWSVVSGPGNAFGQPMQPGDDIINRGGTIDFGRHAHFTDNTATMGGTLGVTAALITSGDTQVSFSNPSLDRQSAIESNVSGDSTPESTLIIANGIFINEGSIVANGPTGSQFTIAVAGTTVSGFNNGTSFSAFQPGYFYNPSVIQADAGNTLTISIGASSEVLNTGVLLADGGTVVINANSAAIAGGFAPVRGIVGIEAGGTVETNAAYASTVTGSTPVYEFLDSTSGNTFKIDNIGSFGGRVSGFSAGDTIDLGTSFAVGSLAFSTATQVLNLEDGSGTILTSLLISSGAFTTTAGALSGGALDGFIIGTGSDGDTVLTTNRVIPTASGTSGTWQSAASWTGNVIPGVTDTPLIGQGATAAFTMTTGASPVTVAAIGITGVDATLRITSNTTATSQSVSDTFGTLEVTSGNTLTATSISSTEPSASVTIDAGATVALSGHLNNAVANAAGTLGANPGNNYADTFSAGTITIDGALLAGPAAGHSGGSTSIGYDSDTSASVTVNAGATVTDTRSLLGSDPTSAGTLTLNGAGATWTDVYDNTDTAHLTGDTDVGYNDISSNTPGTLAAPASEGTAQLLIENGATLTAQSIGYVGNSIDSAGVVTVVNGGLWNVANNGTGSVNIGQAGSGTLLVQSGGSVAIGGIGTFFNNGTTFTAGGIGVGDSIGANGTIIVSGLNAQLSSLDGMGIGKAGQALLDIVNGGTVLIQGNGIGVGQTVAAGSSGTVEVGGSGAAAALDFLPASSSVATGSVSAGSGMSIGQVSQGTLIVSDNGTINLNGTGGIGVGVSANAVGVLTVGGTSVSAAINFGSSGLTIGQVGTGSVAVNNLGTINMSGTGGIIVGLSSTASGTMGVQGGVVNIGASTFGMTVGQSANAQGNLSITSNGTVSDSGSGFNEGLFAGSRGTVSVSGFGSVLQTTGTTGMSIGNQGTGVMSITAGGLVSDASFLTVGNSTGAVGTLAVNGGTFATTGTNGITVGNLTGAAGTLTVQSGLVTARGFGLNVGNVGTGIVQVMSGGSIVLPGTVSGTIVGGILIGQGSGGSGSMTVGGGGVVDVDLGGTGFGLTVGQVAGAQANLSIQAGGTVAVGAGSVTEGSNIGATGTVTVSGIGAELQTTGTAGIGVGNSGSGQMTISAGGLVSDAGSFNIASSIGSSGTVLVNGGSLSVGNGMAIGNSGTGALIVEGGGAVTNNGLNSVSLGGFGAGGSGSVTVNGGTLTDIVSFFAVGGTNTSGSLLVEGGGSLVTGASNEFADINATGTGVAAATVNGATWTSHGSIIVGDTGSGSLTVQTGGVVNAGTSSITIAQQTNSHGTVTVSGTGAQLTGGNLTVAQGSTSSGVLNIGTGGVVTMKNASIDIGGTASLSGGTLVSSNTNLGISSGAQLTGFGKVSGNVSNNGEVIATGGLLEITGGIGGGITIGAGSTLKLDGGAAGGASIGFTAGSPETLMLGAEGAVNNFTISNWEALDSLEFGPGITATSASLSGTTLTVNVTGTSAPGSKIQITNVTTASGTALGFVTGTDGATNDSFIQAVANTIAAVRTLSWTGTAGGGNVATAANWNDLTDSIDPATVAPGAADTAEFLANGGALNGTVAASVLQFGAGQVWAVGTGAKLTAGQGISTAAGEIAISGGGTIASTGTEDVISGASGQAGAAVSVSGTGSTWSDQGTLTIGSDGVGSLSIDSGGTASSGGGAVIANTASASGSSVNVVGSGSNWQVSGALVIGNAATGSLDIAAAGSVAAASIDTGAAAAGAGIITVSGTSTALSTAGSLIVGDLGTGELSVLSGAQLSAANITIGAQTGSTGNVDVEGNATQLTVSGTVTIGGLGSGVFTLGSGTTLTTGGGVFTTINGVFNQSGEVDPPHVVNDGQTNLSKGARTLADISIENSNEYTLQNGAATMYTPLITFDANPATDQGSTQGTWLISNAGTLVLNADTVDASQTIDFSATNAVLEIGQHPSMANGTITGTVAAGAANVLPGFGAPIENYRSGDKITFPGLTFGSDTASGNVVTLWSGLAGTGTELGSLDFITPSGAPDSAGALLAEAQIATLACFAEGTRISTEDGPVAVEKLTVGDRVVTHDGAEQPVVWIGSRTVDCARHTTPETVWPVRVEAGAFGENVPVRDLYLSPDHAVFVDGVLVPVKLLINGGTIEQVKRRTVTYYHVELPAHDVILAEDLPVESYLDTGDRGNFEDEHVVRLFPDFDARPRPEAALVWETKGCAELVMAGKRLERLRKRSSEREASQMRRSQAG